MDRWTGRMLGGRFQLLRVLGRGAVTAVYEAENVTIGRRVAIKLLEPHARLVERNARRFVREAKLLSRVSHPNIVSVLDIEEDRITSALFMVQELLEGTDLRTLLHENGPLSRDEALAIMQPIEDALRCAHRAGIVHRDVTEANIFLAGVGERTVPKLIDFGRARTIGRGSDPAVDIAAFRAVLESCVAPAHLRAAG